MLFHRREFLGLLAAGGAAGTMQSEFRASQPGAPGTSAPAVARRGDPWLEINTAHLVWNLRQIEARVEGKPVMAVIKANAYGHGLVGTARALASAGVRHFLVGKLDEALGLRAAGVRGRILNFGPFSESDADDLIRLEITQNVYTKQVEILDRAARRRGRRASVQIKVDTGLGRVGVPHDHALDFIEQVAGLRGIAIEGVFTTLTEDHEFDSVQLKRLEEISTRAAQAGRAVGARHAASSDAILDLPAACTNFDMVRPGILLYGLYPSTRAEQERRIELRPVLTLKARIAYVKTLRPGESVSYHRVFTASKPERVATLPVGYSDGYPRALAGKGHVLIAGRRCSIVAVTANAMMARLDNTPAAPGDEAVLIGSQENETISASEIAGLTQSSVYGVVIGMSGLLPQIYV